MPASQNFRDITSNGGTDATAEIAIPPLTVNGDLMIAFLSHSSGAATITSAPSGWALREADPNPADFATVCYTKIKAAGDANPAIWTWSAAGQWSAEIVSFFDIDQVTPINVSIGEQGTALQTISLGPITTTVNGCILVGYGACDASGTPRLWSESGTMFELLADPHNHNGLQHMIADELVGAAGSYTRDFTQDGNTQDMAGFLLALQPATTTTRRAQLSWVELETPLAPRRAQLSWAELQLPLGPRRAQLSWTELETPLAPRRTQLSWVELEIPLAPRRAQVSWTELQSPFGPRRGQSSWLELEVPLGPRRARLSWLEGEVPLAPRRGQVSWTELELPLAPRRAQLSWAELETPVLTANRAANLSWLEFQTPLGPRRGLLSWMELESPSGPRRGRLSWIELETPLGPRRAQLSWAELESPFGPRRGQLSHFELESPLAPRRGQLSWAELEIPNVPRRGQVSFFEFEIPPSPALLNYEATHVGTQVRFGLEADRPDALSLSYPMLYICTDTNKAYIGNPETASWTTLA